MSRGARASGSARPLTDRTWTFQSPLWQTNTLLAVSGDDALLVDPAYFPGEIEAIAAEVSGYGGASHLLITHADFDHTCGIGAFPAAEVIAGPETAARIAGGEAAAAVASQGPEWGAAWSTDLRVDRVVDAGTTFEAGAFRVSAIEAAGHVADGLAFVLEGERVLLPGDYLSAITIPYAAHSVAQARATTRRLLDALEERDLLHVVPGHGPALTRDEARDVARADLAYLDRVIEAAAEAKARELPAGPALLHVYAVAPPRPETDDFAVYGIRASNAKQALAEAT